MILLPVRIQKGRSSLWWLKEDDLDSAIFMADSRLVRRDLRAFSDAWSTQIGIAMNVPLNGFEVKEGF